MGLLRVARVIEGHLHDLVDFQLQLNCAVFDFPVPLPLLSQSALLVEAGLRPLLNANL